MSRNHLETVWTPEVMEYFLALTEASENFSYLEIATRLSTKFDREFSKNACIGKARRMGLPYRSPQLPLAWKVKPKPRPIDPTGIPIEELERNSCRFAYGKVESRPPYMYCGKSVAWEGGSWCRKHCDKVFAGRRQ